MAGDYGEVGRHDEARRHVTACLIHQENGVGARRNGRSDLDEMQVHCLGIAGKIRARAFALLRADGTKDVGRGGALIAGSARPGAALKPTGV